MRALWQRVRTAARTTRATALFQRRATTAAAASGAAARPTPSLWRRAALAAAAAGGIGVAAGTTAARAALFTPIAAAKPGTGGVGEDGKPCKTCPPGMDGIMKHLGRRAAEQQQHQQHQQQHATNSGSASGGSSGSGKKAAVAAAAAGAAAAVGAAVVATRNSSGSGDAQAPPPSSSSSSSSSDAAAAAAPAAAPAAASRDPLPCPPDYIALGHSTWTFLHTMAQHYPPADDEDDADPLQPRGTASPLLQHRTRELLQTIAIVYPCASCAAHMRAYIRQHPPDVANGPALQQWLCAFHNAVNAESGKPQFDCSRLDERWGGGPKGAGAARCA